MRRPALLVAGLTLTGFLGLGAAGCGSDDDSSAATTTASTLAPEDIIVDDATVTAGLKKLPSTIDSAIAAIGTPDAKAKLDAIQAEWFSFEGTIRENDTELYLAIEDQLSPLQAQIEDGERETATATAATLDGLFQDYLAKYPG